MWFLNGIDIDSKGSRGGLCLAWKGDINVQLQSFLQRQIDVTIKDMDEFYKWRFTRFYGSPYYQEREATWRLLRQLRQTEENP